METNKSKLISTAIMKNTFKALRRHVLKWSVQRPILSISLVVLGAVALLPIVTAAALMPIALLLTYSGVVASQGIVYVIYNILIQGLILAMVIVSLFIGGFVIATILSVFHSYKIFITPSVMRKTD